MVGFNRLSSAVRALQRRMRGVFLVLAVVAVLLIVPILNGFGGPMVASPLPSGGLGLPTAPGERSSSSSAFKMPSLSALGNLVGATSSSDGNADLPERGTPDGSLRVSAAKGTPEWEAQWWAACDAREAKKPPPANTTAEDLAFIKDARRTYVSIHKRCPPPGYGMWLLYAREKECELHDYRYVERDFLPFRQYFAGKPDLFKRLQAAMGVMDIPLDNQRKMHLEYGVIVDGQFRGQTLPMDYLKFVADAMHFLPDIQVFFSNLDEPRVVPREKDLINVTWIEEFEKAYDNLFEADGKPKFQNEELLRRAEFLDVSRNISISPNTHPVFKRVGFNESVNFVFDTKIPFDEVGHQDVLNKIIKGRCPIWTSHPAVAPELEKHGAFRCPVTSNLIPYLVPIFSATKAVGFPKQMAIPDMETLERKLKASEMEAEEFAKQGWKIGSLVREKEGGAAPAPAAAPAPTNQSAETKPAATPKGKPDMGHPMPHERNLPDGPPPPPPKRLQKRAEDAKQKPVALEIADLQDRNYFSNCFYDILVPDPYNLKHAPPRVPSNPANMKPWAEKQSKLIWRGATTGGFTSDDGCKEHHRHIGLGQAKKIEKKWAELSSSGKKTPNISIDVGFTMVALCQNCGYIQQNYPTAGSISFGNHFDHKYLLDMDGNSYSQRFELFMFGNSLGMRAGVHEAWYEQWVEPWVHYVPLRVDMTDLEEKLVWLAEHDDIARR